MRRFTGRLLTTWPVLAETCHFLPERTQIELLRWADAGGIVVVDLHESALRVLADWKEKYFDLPMDLADASLVWLASDTDVTTIMTLDRRDFSRYRLPDGRSFEIL